MTRHLLWMISLAFVLATSGCSDDDSLDPSGGSGGSAGSTASGSAGNGTGGGSEAPTSCYTDEVSTNQSGSGILATTPHYELYSELDLDETQTIARLLEASWQAFEDYFHEAPLLGSGELLQVKLYIDFDAWQAGMISNGVSNPPSSAGGYFDPATRTAYLYQQPTLYYTRVLALHEVAHQFHLLGRGKGASPPSWYVEGIAEYISRHDWDGSCVKLGVLPLLSQEDPLASALETVKANGLNLTSVVNDQGYQRPIAMAVTRYFETADGGAHADDYQAFEDAVDINGANATTAFNDLLGMPSSYDAPIEAWLQNEQEPMSVMFREWTHISSTSARGRASGVLTIARLKKPTQQFAARYTGPGEGGFLIAYDNSMKYVAVVLRSTGKVEKFSYLSDSPLWLSTTMTVPAASEYDMSFERVDEDTITLTVNGSSANIDHGSATPAGGLAVHDSDLVFRDISWN